MMMINTFLRDQLVARLRQSFPEPQRVFDLLDYVPENLSGSVYRSLRAAERAGLVSRCQAPNDKRVFWTYLPSEVLSDSVFEQWEKQWDEAPNKEVA